jgi:hypothetical protein
VINRPSRAVPIKLMTNTRLMGVASAVVFAIACVSVFACSPVCGNETVPAIAQQTRDQAPSADAPASAPAIARNSPQPGVSTAAKDRGPLVIQAEVVDSQGRNLAGVDVNVMISYPRPLEGPERIVYRAVSDHDGRIRMDIAHERVEGRTSGAMLWAYQPGRAVATSNVSLQESESPPVIRLTLEQPVKRTITVRDAGDRPVEGIRLAPRSIRQGTSPVPREIPEELLERLTVTTDSKGEATLISLPQRMEPLTVRVAGPGFAAHTLALSDIPQKGSLTIGRTGRLVGIIREESGQPLPGISVVVWARTPGIRVPGMFAFTPPPPAQIRFNTRSLTTGREGAFQTPSNLLNGSTYRVSIRQDGFAPFVSEWVTLGGDRTPIPPIRLRALKKITGQIVDRQGRPVGDARVFLPAGGPSAMTDAQGRFDLRNVLPDKTIVVVQQPGFRFQGWPVDPATQVGALRLTLVRMSEAPDRKMAALAEPIPTDEARSLANRVLEPYLQKALEQGTDFDKSAALEALSTFDLERALELFRKDVIQNERSSSYLRSEFVGKLAEQDPTAAVTLVEPIADRALRARGLLTTAAALPAYSREQKRQLLEKVDLLVRGMPNLAAKVSQFAAIAGAWLELGSIDRSRAVLHEGLKVYDSLPYSATNNSFLSQLIRLEPELALARIQKVPRRDRFLAFADVAPELTIDRRAEAERFFNRGEYVNVTISGTLRLCRRLARVDPPRARRVAAALRAPGERVCAWAFVALGLAEKDHAGALDAVDQAITEIDRLRESGPGPEPGIILTDVRVMYPTNPAALILPVVERIAPERLAEVFWRAVALHPRIDIDREDLLRSSYIGLECMLLARYGREVAAVLFEPMDSYLRSLANGKSDITGFKSSDIVGKSCLDPRAAVELLEALPAAPSLGQGEPANAARLYLARALGQPPEKRWTVRWRYFTAQLPLDD